MNIHVGAIPLAVLHLVNQSINIVLMVAELPNVRSVDDHVGAVPLAVFHLANQ
jgi:hypothetical protein